MHDPSKPNGYLRTVGSKDLTALSDYLCTDVALRNRFTTLVRAKCNFYYGNSGFKTSSDDCRILLHALLEIIDHQDYLDFSDFDSALVSLLHHEIPLARSTGMIVLGCLYEVDKALASKVAADFIKRQLHIDMDNYEDFSEDWAWSVNTQINKAILRIVVDPRMLWADRAAAEKKAQEDWADSARTELGCEARFAPNLTQEFVWGWAFMFVPAGSQKKALEKEATCFIDRISFWLRPQLDERMKDIDARLTVWHEGQVAMIN